jgi:hypothetical protein
VTNTLLSFQFEDNLVENGSLKIPASPHGAVGVSRLVAVVNSMLEVRLKNGTILFRDGLASFFSRFPEATVTNNSSFSSPKVI